MKKTISFIILLFTAIVAFAENGFRVEALDIQPGEEKTVSVVLENEEDAKSVAIDISLPAGLSFVGTNGSVEFSTRAASMASKQAKIQTSGALRIGLLGLGGVVEAGTGELFSFKVKAADDATAGVKKIQYLNMSVTYSGKVTIPSFESSVTVYEVVQIIVSASNEQQGEVQGGGEYQSGQSAIITASPAEGYHFVGWTAKGATVSTDNPYTFTVATDQTMTAQFAPNQYAMTFVLGNGQDNVVKTQDYASALAAPVEPARTGFTFTGWSPEVPSSVPAGDRTFTAQWERNSYKVTWVVDGQVTEVAVPYEGAIIKPEDPVKEGYTFTGWDKEPAATMGTENLTYTAQFAVNQYAMTFVLGNGQDDVVKKQDYASALAAPAEPERTGFTFKGWSPEVPAAVPAADRTFTAQWERNTYKVTWVVDGQSTQADVPYGEAVTKPADPEKEGYTFTGWDKEPAATMGTENLTYTAQFTVNQYLATFMVDKDTIQSTRQDYGADIVIPEIPNKEGYTFDCWTPSVDVTQPAHNVTYYAEYKVNVYAVVYIVNGQEWARDSIAYGEEIVMRNYDIIENEKFMGWISDDTYTVMPAHDVVFTANIVSGIIRLLSDSAVVDVYTIDGRLVMHKVPVEQLTSKLPKGMYIINGKKIAVK